MRTQLTLEQVAANHGCSTEGIKAKFRQILANLRASSDPKTNSDYRWSRTQARAIAKRMAELNISET